MQKNKYDVAAYIWPAYTGADKRANIFWPNGIGEWQTIQNAKPKFEGHDWPRKPLWGYVDEADPKVMEQQIAAAVSHGVNVFIYDWYWYDHRPFLENCLNDGFLKAKNCQDMQFYLMWSNHDAVSVWDSRLSDRKNEPPVWLGAVDRAEFERIALRMITKYFTQKNYYKINGEPVLMIYFLQNLITGLGGVEKAADALNWFKRQVKKAGFPGLHLQAVKRSENYTYNASGVDGGEPIDELSVITRLGFSSVTNYQFVHITDVGKPYLQVLAEIEKIWNLMEKFPLPYFPHVSIGWDNNPRHTELSQPIMTNCYPENFEKALCSAKEYLRKNQLPAPLVTVNSWNEWTEGSYLEPDEKFGYGFLQAIKNVFG